MYDAFAVLCFFSLVYGVLGIIYLISRGYNTLEQTPEAIPYSDETNECIDENDEPRTNNYPNN